MRQDIQNRADIEKLMEVFYGKLLVDKELSFIFIEVAKIDIKKHLPILCDFWESILFPVSKYRRNAMEVHLKLNEKHHLTKAHFEKWLSLFDETVDELFTGEKAHQAKVRALSIATIMQMKIDAT